MENLEIERKWIFNDSEKSKSFLNVNLHLKKLVNLEIGYTKDDIRVSHFKSFDVKNKKEKIFYRINTKKSINGTLVRQEDKCDITENVYKSIFEKTLGRRIIKKRFIYELDSLILEIDEFEYCKIPNLKLIEVEFSSEKEANNFKPSYPIFGIEVTNDFRFLNINLAF